MRSIILAPTEAALQKLGLQKLRPQQEAPLAGVLSGADIVVILATGGGKSLLYQLPAVLDGGHQLTLVISPLRALQADQVAHLTARGIRAAVLNSDLTPVQHAERLAGMCAGGGLLYLAPEQLQNPAVAFALRKAEIARIAVDEAHTLPQVQDDFRKAYGRIGTFVRSLPQRPQLLALTATATPGDVQRIRESLGMRGDTKVYRAPVRRDNLRLSVKQVQDNGSGSVRFRAVERALTRWNGKGAAIVFCPTVKIVKRLHRWLKTRGYRVGKYHGKMKPDKRTRAQDRLMRGDTPIMVAPNAFGLGVDKPDVRLVVHAGLPLSLDGYVQEIGRAGRDGKKARCVLIYAKSDFGRNKNILSRTGGKKAVRRKCKRLNALQKLLASDKCLWRGIERYFGEKPGKKCGKCCVCRKKRH